MADASTPLTPAQRRAYRRDGFVVLRGLFDADDAAYIRDEVRATPGRGRAEVLSRGGLEFRSALFQRNEALRALAAEPRVVAVVTSIAGPDAWIRWDQAVAKAPGAGWFPWHQDNGYSELRHAHVQLWIALTPMRAAHGSLLLDPGSHRRGLLPHRSVGSERVFEGTPRAPRAIEAEPGDAVVFDSFLLHATGPNTTREERWAYVLEYLPLRHADPSIPLPHVVVARGGRPVLELRHRRSAMQRAGDRVRDVAAWMRRRL